MSPFAQMSFMTSSRHRHTSDVSFRTPHLQSRAGAAVFGQRNSVLLAFVAKAFQVDKCLFGLVLSLRIDVAFPTHINQQREPVLDLTVDEQYDAHSLMIEYDNSFSILVHILTTTREKEKRIFFKENEAFFGPGVRVCLSKPLVLSVLWLELQSSPSALSK